MKRIRQASEAPLAGKLLDDRGNRMSPSWAKKGSKRWCYYVSQAALQGDKSKAGSVVRVAANAIEHRVADAISKQPADCSSLQADLRDLIDRVTIGRTAIQVQLSETAEADVGARTMTIPWTPSSHHRKGEILQSGRDVNARTRPMRANARAVLVDALGDSHRWLDELLFDPDETLESLASREGKTDRSIRMTLSLAFLAPHIVKAAVEGRLPRGYGLKRLVDLPMAWPDQWQALGLHAPART
ncbi:MAG TPA: hypothetical protein VGG77_08580 [Roseiarcus sp.]|jgi:hypothetical protein